MGQLFNTFVGVDAASGHRPFTFVSIDPNRKLQVVGGGNAVDVLSYVAGRNDVLIALSPPWRKARLVDGSTPTVPLPVYRLAGLHQPSLLDDSQPAECPRRMRESLALLTRLQEIGFQPFPQADAPRQWLEAPAETGFQALLGVQPFEAGILEGRIQRQLVLSDLELDVPDAMEFFEEVTRFRLLHSQLPYECVLPQPELNAWLAAATAWMAVHDPDRACAAGAPTDGTIFHLIPPP